MVANTGAVVGSQMPSKKDAPQCKIGYKMAVALVGFRNAVQMAENLHYKYANRRYASKERGVGRRGHS